MKNDKMMNIKRAILLVVFPSVLLSCASEENKDTAQEKVHVKVIQAEMQEYRLPVRTSGKTASAKELKLSFKTGGVIDEINSSEGDKVNKGQLLASIKTDEIKAKMEQAQLALEKSKRDLQRIENLYSDSVATLEQLQNTRTALNAAQAQFDIAEFNYEHSVIKAPSNGIVLKKLAEAREIIAPGHPVFLFASTESNWIVKGSLTDREIVRVELNDSAEIHMDAFPDFQFYGRITQLGQIADPYTGTFDVEVQILNPPPKMASGFVVSMFIWPGNFRHDVLIPVECLKDAEKTTGMVYKMINGKAMPTKVKLGELVGEKVVIKEGLMTGDSIVKDGINYIDDNKEIVIEE